MTLLTTLAWRPFLEPLDLHYQWLWLLLPMCLAISIVYKTLKLDKLNRLPVETLRLTGLILFFMALAAAGLWLLTEFV